MDGLNQPIVFDNGSGVIKSGFAGEERPKAAQANVVGREKYKKVMASSHTESYVGSAAREHRGVLRLTHPMTHGAIEHWDDMERVWLHAYAGLEAQPDSHPLLITEAPFNSKAHRMKMGQVLFESFGVPCCHIAQPAVLALYALGRTTGVVADIGDGVAQVAAVYNGFSLPSAVKRMDVAGRDISSQLALHIRQMSGVHLHLLLELDIARDIKEQCCIVSKDVASDEKLYAASTYTHFLGAPPDPELFAPYKLPDGQTLHLGAERFRAPEILFDPQIVGDESPGIHELISLAIAKADLDLRLTLYQNILLLGGSTMIRGLGERLIRELKESHILAKGGKQKIKVYAPPERKYLAWIGGSILANLSLFRHLWITAKEYEENPDRLR